MRVPSDVLCEGTMTSIPDVINLLIRQSFVFTCYWKVLCNSFFSLSDHGLVPDLLAVRDLVPCLLVNGDPGLVPRLPEDATTLVLAVALFPQREEGGKKWFSGQVFWAKISLYLPVT